MTRPLIMKRLILRDFTLCWKQKPKKKKTSRPASPIQPEEETKKIIEQLEEDLKNSRQANQRLLAMLNKESQK